MCSYIISNFLFLSYSAEFQIFKGQDATQRIPFQMHWRACCMTLDKVKCSQYPPITMPHDKEAFFYVHPLRPGDTYSSITQAIPVESGKCVKGIVIISNLSELESKFWTTPYAIDEALLPLYLVGVEDGQLLLQKVQPQQPLPLKVGPVQPKCSRVQLDHPEALHIRFIPKSGGKLMDFLGSTGIKCLHKQPVSCI